MIPLPEAPPAPPVPGRTDVEYETGKQTPGVFKHVEIEIVTVCDCHCHGCDRWSDVTTDQGMSVKQVELFVQESLDLKWEWERIRILGGEPTLSVHFREMVEVIMRYRQSYPKVYIQVLSNGLGKLKEHRAWLIDHGIDPHVEAKEKGVNPPWFENCRWCQVDRDPNVGAVPPCGVFGVRGCGLGVSRYGIFLDGAGASAARVAGIDCGIQHLKDVTWEAMLDQAKVLCRICGKWNAPPPAERVTKLVSETGPTTGPYWAEKLAAFHKQRPKLTVYGE